MILQNLLENTLWIWTLDLDISASMKFFCYMYFVVDEKK